MDISQADLNAEVTRALAQWPFLHTIETGTPLPHGLLLAVGSRETNLTNELGDSGHGWGVWQLDNRSHVIPPGFLDNVLAQATEAVAMLTGLIESFPGNLHAAVAAYNCGAGNVKAAMRNGLSPDVYTTGGQYGADVLERLAALQPLITTPPTTTTITAPKGSDEMGVTLLVCNGQGIAELVPGGKRVISSAENGAYAAMVKAGIKIVDAEYVVPAAVFNAIPDDEEAQWLNELQSAVTALGQDLTILKTDLSTLSTEIADLTTKVTAAIAAGVVGGK